MLAEQIFGRGRDRGELLSIQVTPTRDTVNMRRLLIAGRAGRQRLLLAFRESLLSLHRGRNLTQSRDLRSSAIYASSACSWRARTWSDFSASALLTSTLALRGSPAFLAKTAK